MQKNTMITFLVICSFLILASLIAIKSMVREKPEEERAKIEIASTDDTDSEKDGDGETIEARKRLRELRKKLSNSFRAGTIQTDVETQDDSSSYRTEEERAYLSELLRRTDSVYFDMAPEILEEMWSAQENDPDWTSDMAHDVKILFSDKEFNGSQLKFVDCGTRLCKIKAVFENKTVSDYFHSIWLRKGPRPARDYGHQNELEGGKWALELYFTKEADDKTFIELRERMVSVLDHQ